MAIFTIELNDGVTDAVLKLNAKRRSRWPDESIEQTIADLVIEGLETFDLEALGIGPDT